MCVGKAIVPLFRGRRLIVSHKTISASELRLDKKLRSVATSFALIFGGQSSQTKSKAIVEAVQQTQKSVQLDL